jgi:hypothetical protein
MNLQKEIKNDIYVVLILNGLKKKNLNNGSEKPMISMPIVFIVNQILV